LLKDLLSPPIVSALFMVFLFCVTFFFLKKQKPKSLFEAEFAKCLSSVTVPAVISSLIVSDNVGEVFIVLAGFIISCVLIARRLCPEQKKL